MEKLLSWLPTVESCSCPWISSDNGRLVFYDVRSRGGCRWLCSANIDFMYENGKKSSSFIHFLLNKIGWLEPHLGRSDWNTATPSARIVRSSTSIKESTRTVCQQWKWQTCSYPISRKMRGIVHCVSFFHNSIFYVVSSSFLTDNTKKNWKADEIIECYMIGQQGYKDEDFN